MRIGKVRVQDIGISLKKCLNVRSKMIRVGAIHYYLRLHYPPNRLPVGINDVELIWIRQTSYGRHFTHRP